MESSMIFVLFLSDEPILQIHYVEVLFYSVILPEISYWQILQESAHVPDFIYKNMQYIEIIFFH